MLSCLRLLKMPPQSRAEPGEAGATRERETYSGSREAGYHKKAPALVLAQSVGNAPAIAPAPQAMLRALRLTHS
jgi:hypothetical protein